MKIITILCLLAAIASGMASLFLFSPSDAWLQFYHAHDVIEQVASEKNATDELKTATVNERAAAKNLIVGQGISRMFVWPAVGFSSLALLTTLFGSRKKESDKK